MSSASPLVKIYSSLQRTASRSVTCRIELAAPGVITGWRHGARPMSGVGTYRRWGSLV